jgi:hypothetical protein
MKTVPFQEVLHGVCDLMGIDPVQLQLNQARPLVSYINSAVRRGWEMDAWWPWTVLEERRWRSAWLASVSYAVGDEVWNVDDAKYYRATVASVNERPDLTPGKWEEHGPAPWLSLDDGDYCPVGNVVAVYDGQNREYNFTLQGSRVFVGPPAPGLPVLCYTRPVPKFTAEPYENAVNYLAGQLVYVAEVGECYKARVDTVGEYPPTFDSSWAKVCFPYLLAEYVKQEAYGKSLETDGQSQRAMVAQARAEKLLEEELDRIFFQQQQTRRFRVIR